MRTLIAFLILCATTLAAELHYPGEDNPATPEALQLKKWVDGGQLTRPFGVALTHKLYGDQKYALKALDFVDPIDKCSVRKMPEVAKAGALAGSPPGTVPCTDGYLQAGERIRKVVACLAWCRNHLTVDEIAALEDYCRQNIYNLWNQKDATWYGVPRKHSVAGWGVDNPASNYHHSYIQATLWWALYSNDGVWIEYLKNNRLPGLMSYFATTPEGGGREGVDYATSHRVVLEAIWMWKAGTGEDLTGSFAQNSALYWAHATRPDGKAFAPIGDLVLGAGPLFYTTETVRYSAALFPDGDPAKAGRWWVNSWYPKTTFVNNAQADLIYIPGDAAAPSALSYSAIGVGHYFARSGWTPDATYISAVCGINDEGHSHQQHGEVNLFAKGKWQVGNLNVWGSNNKLFANTEAHSVVRLEQNGKVMPQVRSAPGTVPLLTYADATVTDNGVWAAEMDLSRLYNLEFVGGKPRFKDYGITWRRNVNYVRPGTVQVLDLTAGADAIYQLHSETQPIISGNTVTLGGVNVTVQWPLNPQITAVNLAGTKIQGVGAVIATGYRLEVRGGPVFMTKIEVTP